MRANGLSATLIAWLLAVMASVHPGIVRAQAPAGGAGACPGGAQSPAVYLQTCAVGTAAVAPPSEYFFTASSAAALTVTLTDFQAPAAFTSLQVAVTLDGALVGTATLQSGATTATLSVPAAAGSYGLHVIGTPNATQGLGTFGVCVAPAGNATACIAADSFSGTVQTPATPSSNGASALVNGFTSTVAGTYTITLTDDAFPAALASVSAGIAQGATFIAVNIPTGTTQLTLSAATSYTLLVAAQADPTTLAGLYGVQITDPNGQVVYGHTLPVGKMTSATNVSNPAAQSLQLSLSDLAYPAPLASLGVAITSGATALTPPLLVAGTTPSFQAPAGVLSLWQYPVATAQPGVYSVTLAGAGGNLYSAVQVAQPANALAATSFAYVVTVPAAGTYTVAATDFQFPVALQSLSVTVAQQGQVLTPDASGNVTAAAGPVVVLVNAQSATGSSGIFAVTMAQSGSSTLLLDQTQAVGGVFSTGTFTFGSAGAYEVSLNDLAVPTAFQNLAMVVSSGGHLLGKIYGSGTFPISLQPGQYSLIFVATPGAQNYGLYSIDIVPTKPSVTLSASATSVAAGQPVQLTWSSQNATSCAASGATGWNGSEPQSGTAGVTITASVTLTLTCSGAGGSASQSVSVAATGTPPASGSGGGGGGALDPAWVLGLLALVLARARLLQDCNKNSRPVVIDQP